MSLSVLPGGRTDPAGCGADALLGVAGGPASARPAPRADNPNDDVFGERLALLEPLCATVAGSTRPAPPRENA